MPKVLPIALCLLGISLLGSGCPDWRDVARNADGDGDGSFYPDDCAPTNPEIHPAAFDPIGDGVDQNCDGTDGVDRDRDGWGGGSGADCNDGDPSVHPDAEDPVGDNRDQNCDGVDGVAGDVVGDDDVGDDDTTHSGDDDDDDDDTTSPPHGDDDTAGGADDDDATGPANDDDDDDVGPDPTPCPCDFGQLCVEGLCLYSDTFAIGLLEGSNNLATDYPSTNACFWRSEYLSSITAVQGDCVARFLPGSQPVVQYVASSAGEVTVTGGMTDPIVFDASGSAECLDANVTDGLEDLFESGQTLTFVGSGGADFPQFTASLLAPAPIEGSATSIAPGSAVEMSWDSGDSDYVEITVATESITGGDRHAIVCRTGDVGTFLVPPSMTITLPTDNTGYTVSFSRNRVAHLEYEDLARVIDVVVQTSWVQMP